MKWIASVAILFPLLAAAKEIPKEDCVTHFSARETARIRATPEQVLRSIAKLRTKAGTLVFSALSADLEAGVKKYFTAKAETSSRLEHFYALLFLIGRELKDRDELVELDIESARSVMRESRVFPNNQLTDAMTSVNVEWQHYSKKAEWEVKLDTPELVIALNDGQGFRAYNHGRCQNVEKLHIYGGFHVSLFKNKDDNVVVKFREPVDFSGDFGSRGVANVDVKYVSLYEIEFLHGSKLGTSRAKIAKREFDEGDHSWFLELVAGMVSEKSTQPIDW